MNYRQIMRARKRDERKPTDRVRLPVMTEYPWKILEIEEPKPTPFWVRALSAAVVIAGIVCGSCVAGAIARMLTQ
jgi:hypothetical protein